MDKVDKTLKKLNRTDRGRALATFKKLKAGDFSSLDIKRLKESSDVYRVRTGDLRIIFKKVGSTVEIVDLGYRSEKTYRDI